mgnify:CR=1 FL=1
MALTNNDVLKKIRVALQLRDDDIIEILSLVDFRVSKSELGAFFRKEGHPNYKELQDQILRNFLNGLVIYKRGPMEERPKKDNTAKLVKPNPIKAKGNFKKGDNKDFNSRSKSPKS